MVSLAEGLSEALRLRTKETPDSYAAGINPKILRGVLQACVDQSSSFLWHPYLEGVKNRLQLLAYYPGGSNGTGRPDNTADLYQCLSVPVLQASLNMLAAVQQLCRDRLMVVEGDRSAITMVVWAHYVLGLTVLVQGSPTVDVAFGTAQLSIVIQFPQNELLWHSMSAAHLMNASGEKLLRIKQEETSSISEITAERRIPIQGYGMRMLEELQVQLTKAAIIDMGRYAGGLVLICAEHMYDQNSRIEQAEIHCTKAYISSKVPQAYTRTGDK